MVSTSEPIVLGSKSALFSNRGRARLDRTGDHVGFWSRSLVLWLAGLGSCITTLLAQTHPEPLLDLTGSATV